MNRDAIERLLIDRALGSLDPDTRELLEAYLEHDKAAAASARVLMAVADLARQAMPASGAEPVPLPLPRSILAQAYLGPRRIRLVRLVDSMAACLLLGIGVGAWIARPARTVVERPQASAAMVANPPQARLTKHGCTGLWSLKRLYEERRESEPSERVQVKWISPLRAPRFGEST